MDDAELKRLAEAATHIACNPLTTLARFHTAANPATILRLLRERDEARAAVAKQAATIGTQLEIMRDGAATAGHWVKCVDAYAPQVAEEFQDTVTEALEALDADQGEGDGT